MSAASRYVATSLKFAVGSFSILVVALTMAVPSAKADDFTFSFSNDPAFGNVSGTVTGEILGLPNNGTGSATEVLITSFPAGLNSVFGSTPIDVSTWTNQLVNTFTVTNGVITAADFEALDTIGAFQYGGQLYIDVPLAYSGNTNFLNVDGTDSSFVWNNNGLDGVTFGAVSATPEPSSLALMTTGMMGAAGACWRRSRRAKA